MDMQSSSATGEWTWQARRPVAPHRYWSPVLRFLVAVFVALVIAALGERVVSMVICGIATGVLLLGVASPPRAKALERSVRIIVLGSLAWILFAPFYFTLLPLMRLLMRRGDKRVIQHSLQTQRDSYYLTVNAESNSFAPSTKPYLERDGG